MNDNTYKLSIGFHKPLERVLVNQVRSGAANCGYTEWFASECIKRGGMVGDRMASFMAGTRYTELYHNIEPGKIEKRTQATMWAREDVYLMINAFKEGVHADCSYRDLAVLFLMEGGVPLDDTRDARSAAHSYGLTLFDTVMEFRGVYHEVS